MTRATIKARFAFVDALRGVAALWVVVFHVYSKNLSPMTGYEFPEPLHSIFDNGRLGVHVFFVISGFVIAQSIRNELVTPRYVGWFALRRSIRLDPPYWATIIAMIVLSLVSNHLQHDRSLPIPSAGAVLAHVFYAQGFFGYPDIVGVFWTLCYEIQFYLTLVTLIGVWQWLSREAKGLSRWLLFAPLWIVSLLCIADVFPVTKALFVLGWPYFFLGVVVNWVHNRETSAWWFVVVLVTITAITPFAPLPVLVASGTALAIHIASRTNRLESMTLGSVLQYLGRISYSLYLVHMLVGTPLVRLGIRIMGKQADALHALALLVLGVGASVVAAHVMYVLVERPAMRFSQRLRKAQRPPIAAFGETA